MTSASSSFFQQHPAPAPPARDAYAFQSDIKTLEDFRKARASAPEDFGAIGDGTLRTPRTYLGLTTGSELRAYRGGIYSFASDYDLDSQIDFLAIQAAFYAGGHIVGRPGAHYRINRCLTFPNGKANVDFSGAKLDATSFDVQTSTLNLLTNPSFDDGITGWTQGLLGPRTDIVFAGGKASFTDPAVDAGAHYGDFGQQFTLPAGRWHIRLKIKLSDGASHGFYGPPYMNMGFRPYGVGEGGYDWPHPLSFAELQWRKSPFEGWVSFDVECLETITTWLDIQGGNCNWEVQEAVIEPFLMNYLVWTTGDQVSEASGAQYDVSTWVGGELIGPVDGNSEAGWTGPPVGGILHKNFRGEGARCNFERMFVFGWDVGVTLGSQAFLNYFLNVNIGNSRTCVKFVTGSVNAGENFRFISCILFNAGLILHAEAGGEWNFFGCSFDYSKQMMLLENGAKVSMTGQHFEFNGSETRIAVSPISGSIAEGGTITGVTSGATAKLLYNRAATYGHLVIQMLSGTFTVGETITGYSGSVTAAGPTVYGPYMFDLRGGSAVDFTGWILQGGGAHRGALHMFNLETNMDVFSCSDWEAFGLKTASNTLCTGAGRFLSQNFLGPGNSQLPPMIIRNQPSDIFAGNGRIYGPGSLTTLGYLTFAKPADDIGLLYAAYSDSAPATRGMTPWEQLVSADPSVYTELGYGSLKLEYNPAYGGECRFGLFTPVTPGQVILSEYKISKPAAKTPITWATITSGAGANTIKVSTTAGSSVVTVLDNQAAVLGIYGPAESWGVTMAAVTGNPGGIANSVWNSPHTVKERLKRTDMRYTIDLGPSGIATTTVTDVALASAQTTYTQTNVLMFDSRFWVQVLGFDSANRPIIGQTSFQGEDTFRVPFDPLNWTLRQSQSHYSEPVVPVDDFGVPVKLTEAQYANGRAPAWATHYMQLISWGQIKLQDAASPPPIYLTDFFGNKL